MIKIIWSWVPWIFAGTGMWLFGRLRLVHLHHNIFLISLLLLSLIVVILMWYNYSGKRC